MANIVGSGFQGVVMPVDRDGGVICSMAAARSLGELGIVPELVIIAASGEELLEFAGEAAGSGARAVLVISSGSEEDAAASLEREERTFGDRSRRRAAAGRPALPGRGQHGLPRSG